MNSSDVSINSKILLKTFETVHEFKVGPLNLINMDVRTPSFYVNSTNSVLCYIHLRGQGSDIDIRLVVETNSGITMTEPELTKLVLKYEESVVDSTEKEKITKNIDCTDYRDHYGWSIPKSEVRFVENTEMITIECLITQVCSIVEKCTSRGSYIITARKDTLYDHLNKMFTRREYADVTIHVGDKKFWGHKAILARSPVFDAMFQHEMAEKKENVVNVKDVDPEAFAMLLQYLYLAEIPLNITESPINIDLYMNLLIAADMYQVEELKTILAEILIKHVDVNNVIDYLIIADKYNIPTMKNECLTFVKAHSREVKDTDAFKRMIISHAELAAEMLCFLMNFPKITERI